jgi:hypothetical protein
LKTRLHSIIGRKDSNVTERNVSISKAAMKPINITKGKSKIAEITKKQRMRNCVKRIA